MHVDTLGLFEVVCPLHRIRSTEWNKVDAMLRATLVGHHSSHHIQIVCFIFLCLRGIAPSYLSELCWSVSESEGHPHLRTLGRSQFVIPHLATIGRRACRLAMQDRKNETMELTP